MVRCTQITKAYGPRALSKCCLASGPYTQIKLWLFLEHTLPSSASEFSSFSFLPPPPSRDFGSVASSHCSAFIRNITNSEKKILLSLSILALCIMSTTFPGLFLGVIFTLFYFNTCSAECLCSLPLPAPTCPEHELRSSFVALSWPWYRVPHA